MEGFIIMEEDSIITGFEIFEDVIFDLLPNDSEEEIEEYFFYVD